MSVLDRLASRLVGPLLAGPLGRLVDQRVQATLTKQLAEHLDRHLETAPHVPPNDMLMYELVYGDRAKLHIHPTAVINNALFNLSSGEISVGEYAFFGHNVSVLTGTHDIYKFDRDRQVGVPKTGRDVVIERGVWVSSNAMVLGPCRIGEHAVVGAASVVMSDVAPYTVVAGIPAKPVKTIPPPGHPAAPDPAAPPEAPDFPAPAAAPGPPPAG